MQVSALTGDRVQMLFVSLAGQLIGVDVQKLMIEERKVAQAVIREEDSKTAASVNKAQTVQ